jgi:DnaJ domain
LLGLKEDATINEIKDAYRRLVLEHHPDKNSASKDDIKFKMIVAAYHTLRIKNISQTMINEHLAKHQAINKNQQYEKNSLSYWLNFIYYKIDYAYIKYVRRVILCYLKYEPALFDYSDKIEMKTSILVRRIIVFVQHIHIKIFFRNIIKIRNI